jgi:hypothetical protein
MRGRAVVWALILSGAAVAAIAPRAEAAASRLPTVVITSPRDGGSYEHRSLVFAHYRCIAPPGARIVKCKSTVRVGHLMGTRTPGTHSFTVTAIDTNGNTASKTIHYTVWRYVNPLRAIASLQPSRIDMGIDYSGSGPILALGLAKIVLASDKLAGPESCYGNTCVPPPGDMIVYRLLAGPFAGKYVYAVENITIRVRRGQIVRPGQLIAILHEGSPNLEVGWASGRGAQTLAYARGHQCACTDPGGWSSIEGRNFNSLLAWLGAPSGYTTTVPENQSMPAGWPSLPAGPPT